jgi:hypothetical protein
MVACGICCAFTDAIAGKPRSHKDRILLWERGLPAINDNAV